MNCKYKQLTDVQRYQIEAYLKVNMSKQFISLSEQRLSNKHKKH